MSDLRALDREMETLEREGYFAKAAAGDDVAASLFVRLAVWRANPGGDPAGVGALRKTAGGKNIRGYAEDAIAANADPSDFQNVWDCVGGTGAPGARLQLAGPHPRRASDVWEAPRPLSAEDLAYLKPGGVTPPPPPPPPPPPAQCKFAPADLSAVVAAVNAGTERILAEVARARAESAQAAAAAAEARDEAVTARVVAEDVRAALKNGLAIDLRKNKVSG